jgi:hypothetical protein
MATRSYAIPDLDDDNEIESLNLFSKRQKTDNSSTINETVSSSSIPLMIQNLQILLSHQYQFNRILLMI